MPQFPIPPWPEGPEDEPPPRRRRTRLDAEDPRYADLSLVEGTPEGTIRVLRGDPGLADQLLSRTESERLFDEDSVLVPHLVTWNRLDRLGFVPVGRLVPVGYLEFQLYTAYYGLRSEVSEAGSFEEQRAALRAELDYLDAVEADGWQLITYRRHRPMRLLVDTRRPDERLTSRDLP